ncbi:MAG: hypothetical protein GX428_01175 [Candidatus Atribacteria bacterium]|nr:hypothetical protein [Candidatus Atribacteria bacterium]
MSKITEIELNLQHYSDAIDYSSLPILDEKDYQFRIKALLQLASSQGYTHLIIYGDREHYSNIHFLTGYDPRFEEALLILSHEKEPTIVVGNEGMDYSAIIPFQLQKVLFQSFSLVGQPRGQSKSLNEIFQVAGIQKKSKIGVIGWKYFSSIECSNPSQTIEIPFYIIQELSNLVGGENLQNASDLMTHPDYGLRISLDVRELIYHEIAGTKASQRVLQTIQNLQVGETEIEASRYLAIDGDPLSVHPNVNFGLENVLPGLKSPTYYKKLEVGEIITVGMGYRRALVARTGLYVRKKEEIPPAMEGIVENFYTPYFQALCNWYEALHIGVFGDEVFQTVKKSIGDFKAFGIGLNPGHLTHTEEWTNSIFFQGSTHRVKSGMALQCDIIAFPGEPYGGVHIEDGLFVADEATREIIRTQYPDSWKRIEHRRQIMKEILGIDIADEVMPTSDIQAMLFPYMGNTKIVLSKT